MMLLTFFVIAINAFKAVTNPARSLRTEEAEII
jgi:hypothetical protein